MAAFAYFAQNYFYEENLLFNYFNACGFRFC
jgi:hypothetical protein